MRESIGTDIIEISRIKNAFTRSHRFASRVFTERELLNCTGAQIRWASLAARFAAKEAVSKALGTGIGSIGWRDIEVVNELQGKPNIELHGKAAQLASKMGVRNIAISLSHCKEYAVAFAVIYFNH